MGVLSLAHGQKMSQVIQKSLNFSERFENAFLCSRPGGLIPRTVNLLKSRIFKGVMKD